MTKKQAIQQAILCIAEYFGIPPEHLADQRQARGVRMRNAAASLTYYMHRGGYSYASISRFMGKGDDAIRKLESQGRLMMRGDHAAMIESLPKIPSTLEITLTK